MAEPDGSDGPIRERRRGDVQRMRREPSMEPIRPQDAWCLQKRVRLCAVYFDICECVNSVFFKVHLICGLVFVYKVIYVQYGLTYIFSTLPNVFAHNRSNKSVFLSVFETFVGCLRIQFTTLLMLRFISSADEFA